MDPQPDATPEAMSDPPVDRPAVSTMPQMAAVITQQGKQAADAEREAEAPDLWAPLGDEAREIAEKKKWQTPADLVKGYTEATKRLSQRDEEREAALEEAAEWRAYAAELEARVSGSGQSPQAQSAPAPQQQQGQPAPVDFDALAASCIDPATGEMSYGRMMEMATALGAQMAFNAAEQRMSERLSQFEQEKWQPLAEDRQVAQMKAELESVEGLYGADRYEELGAKIEAEMKDNPAFLDQFGGVRGAFAEMAFRVQQEEAQAEARAADGFTISGGGRRPAQPRLTPEQQEIAAMERITLRPSDGFSLHGRLRWG